MMWALLSLAFTAGVTNAYVDICTSSSSTARWGELESPNFGPGLVYPNNQNCDFVIDLTGDPDAVAIQINFVEFNLENEANCGYDSLMIKDEYNNVVDTLCGSSLPDTLVVPGKKVTLWFTSDHSVQCPGFQLTWDAIDCEDQCKDGTIKDKARFEGCDTIEISDGLTRWFSTAAYSCGGNYSRTVNPTWTWKSNCPGGVDYTIFFSKPSNGGIYEIGDDRNRYDEPGNIECDKSGPFTSSACAGFVGPGDRVVIEKSNGGYSYSEVGQACYPWPRDHVNGKTWKILYWQSVGSRVDRLTLEANQANYGGRGLRFGVKADCAW